MISERFGLVIDRFGLVVGRFAQLYQVTLPLPTCDCSAVSKPNLITNIDLLIYHILWKCCLPCIPSNCKDTLLSCALTKAKPISYLLQPVPVSYLFSWNIFIRHRHSLQQQVHKIKEQCKFVFPVSQLQSLLNGQLHREIQNFLFLSKYQYFSCYQIQYFD